MNSTVLGFSGIRRPWAVCALLLAACAPTEQELPGKELRSIVIDEPAPESPQQTPFSSALDHRALLQRILTAASRQNVSGLFLQVGELNGAWARAADLRDGLSAVRKAKKPVHCYFEVTDNLGYALMAESCDRISITPSGTLDLVGVSLDTLYAHELLHNVGIDAELIQVGRFKGAADALTRQDMPDEVRQTLGTVLDDLQARLVAAIAQGRSLDPERVRALIDRGPLTADDARKAGLVDDIAFDDAARTHAKTAAKADRVVDETMRASRERPGPFDLVRMLFSSEEQPKHKGKRLVLAYLEGTIMRGSPGSYRGAQAEAFVHSMRSFADDDDVRAVVLRIDSPGGSAMASDLMWQAVRKVVKHKPVIVSIGDMCASGGYYVASAGSEIMAQNESLVGSIGVVGGKVVGDELAKRIGVHFEHLGRGKHAGWQSAVRAFTDDERAVFKHHLQDTYDRFIARISEGRKLSPAQLDPYAEGRIMTGRRAREGHLVDSEGGLTQALARARERGGLAKDAAVQVWPERPGLLQALSDLSGGAESRAGLLARIAELSPFERSGLLETLLSGERAAAVLPYVLSVH
jgi:protease-4